MSVSANDIITRSMKAIKVLGRTEVPSAMEASDALVSFNAMLDSWSNENLMSYVIQEGSFPLVVNQSSYTIGPSSANITATRPLEIVQAYVQDSNSNNFPMNIVPRDKWNEIGNRNVTSQIPDTLFYDPQNPNGVINIFPIPLLGYTVFYDSTLDLTQFAALTTTLAMPKGYEKAYVTNLALELISAGFVPMLDQKELEQLRKDAAESKANVKRTNIREVIANYDPAIVSRSYATYNIYRDR